MSKSGEKLLYNEEKNLWVIKKPNGELDGTGRKTSHFDLKGNANISPSLSKGDLLNHFGDELKFPN